MAQRTVDMEPSAAFAGMVTAMAEAGRYAGHGMRTTGKRVGRRARVVGTEAAHRTALAARVLGGRPLPKARRPRAGLVVVVVAATATAAVAARQSVILLRARIAGDNVSVGETAAVDALVGAAASGDGSAND